ncbi:MAG: hypothetical protein AB1512_23855 [Thermodesulfobacteriota bacterium]
MVTAALWLASTLFILSKGALMNRIGLETLDIDLVAILIACLLGIRGKPAAVVFAMGQGILMDIFSAGWPGLFWLLYMAVFFTTNMGGRFFDPYSVRGLFLLVSIAVFLKDLLLMGMLHTFSLQIGSLSSALLGIGVSAFCTGLLAPAVFYAVKGLGNLPAGETGEGR